MKPHEYEFSVGVDCGGDRKTAPCGNTRRRGAGVSPPDLRTGQGGDLTARIDVFALLQGDYSTNAPPQPMKSHT